MFYKQHIVATSATTKVVGSHYKNLVFSTLHSITNTINYDYDLNHFHKGKLHTTQSSIRTLQATKRDAATAGYLADEADGEHLHPLLQLVRKHATPHKRQDVWERGIVETGLKMRKIVEHNFNIY